MNVRYICCVMALSAGLVALDPARSQGAQYLMHFDQDVYFVNGPGETVQARVLIDGDASTPGDDPVPEGLFSFGVGATFDGSKAQLGGFGDIAVEPELDHFGFAPGAFKQVQVGFGGAKGNIDQLGPYSPYLGSLLLEFTFTNLASAVDSYPLELDFFRTVGPDEQMFVNGAGSLLDSEIIFRSAEVRVVPEPAAAVLLILASICLGLWRLCVVRRS